VNSWKVNLGPVAPVLADYTPNPEFTGLGYNPRCLRRDISSAASKGWTKDSDVADLIKNYKDFTSFSTRMQGDFGNGFLGVHTGGHFTIGGDPGGDLFASPGDPAFFLHHAMIDRTWWTWQNLDLKNRQYAIGATITVNNTPPSRNATLDDTIDAGFVGAPMITIRNASHTLAGPFCYIYA
jgi:tyrosinase